MNKIKSLNIRFIKDGFRGRDCISVKARFTDSEKRQELLIMERNMDAFQQLGMLLACIGDIQCSFEQKGKWR